MLTSLFTIVKNRTEQLKNLISHLEQCSPLPDELNVIWMRPPCGLSLIKSKFFRVNHKFTTRGDLPIAKAKNKGLTLASYPLVGHICVDMLPSYDFIAEHIDTTKPGSITVPGSFIAIKEADLYRGYSVLEQEFLNNTLSNDLGLGYGEGLNRSLYFIHRSDIKKVGGYDERLEGFGINDEDFFEQCSQMGIRLKSVSRKVFFQYKKNHSFPVNHLLDFTYNASIFFKKWGHFPEPIILERFAEEGFINRDFKNVGIQINRVPSTREIDQYI